MPRKKYKTKPDKPNEIASIKKDHFGLIAKEIEAAKNATIA